MVSFSLINILALVLTAVATPLPRQNCADVTVFFARGTGEVEPIGTVVGPPFLTALRVALPGRSINFIGVDYPAVVGGFLIGGSPEGAANMANGVTSVANACSNTKIVISGYSQGAQVTHLAAARLSSAVQQRVNAAVVFGDPKRGEPFPGVINGRSITFCAFGDLICSGSAIILPPHLSYGSDAPAAANFVRSRVI
ncbi:hypothetical protein AX16_000388 [Volvariella volvacea WC 439]|nr:hypothetical protein AX16_000388 [Volvariella volvacea WC 439]